MRLLRTFVADHYNLSLRELPDGQTAEGAIIRTDVGRVLAAAVL